MRRRLLYLRLQFKRFFRLFPFVVILTAVLFAALGAIIYAVAGSPDSDEQKQMVRIGVVGDMSDSYLEMGVAAARELDATRFSVEFVTLDEESAGEMLGRGELSAYLIVPDGFARNALHGDIGKVTYVSSAGTVDFGTKITNDLLVAVGRTIINAQKGVFGFQSAAEAAGLSSKEADRLGSVLARKMIDVILSRTALFALNEIGTNGAKSENDSIISGLIVMFFSLWGISCCTVFSARSRQMSRILDSKGFGIIPQVGGEYLAYLVFMLSTFAVIIAGLYAVSGALPEALGEMITSELNPTFVAGLAVPVIALSSMQFFLYELTSGLIPGVLTQFLCAVGMGYITGCMYPVYFFPESVQKFSACLPTGAARIFIASASGGAFNSTALVCLSVYFVFFISASAVVRKLRNASAGGGL